MRNRGPNRGISMGTLLMLILTSAVCVTLAVVLPRLHGEGNVMIDAGRALDALSLTGFQPGLTSMQMQEPTVATGAPSTATPLPVITASAPPAVTPYTGSSATLTFSGTVAIEDSLRKSCYYSESKKYDLDEIMILLRADLKSDLTVMPLDNLVVSGAKVSNLIAPQQAMSMLKNAGADIVSLGFSKVTDQGLQAITETVNAAHAAGLDVIGAFGQPLENSVTERIHNLNGIRVAVLHYTDNLSGNAQKTLSKDGNSWMVPQTLIAAADVALARNLGAEVVIVSIHWGKQGTGTISAAQKATAQILADAGADVIVGTGSRMVQPAIWLDRTDGGQTLCCYSLGNLISDSRTDNGVAGMLLHLSFTKSADGVVRLASCTYTPTYVWRYKQDNAYHYRLVASSHGAPDGMEESQQTSMNRARNTVKTRLGDDSPLVMR